MDVYGPPPDDLDPVDINPEILDEPEPDTEPSSPQPEAKDEPNADTIKPVADNKEEKAENNDARKPLPPKPPKASDKPVKLPAPAVEDYKNTDRDHEIVALYGVRMKTVDK